MASENHDSIVREIVMRLVDERVYQSFERSPIWRENVLVILGDIVEKTLRYVADGNANLASDLMRSLNTSVTESLRRTIMCETIALKRIDALEKLAQFKEET